MDKILDKVAALGVPGLVLLVAMATSGFAGAAAITAALSVLGGPLGMLGGLGVLVVLALIARGLSTYGFEAIFKGAVERLLKGGETAESIRKKILGFPISHELKLKVIDHLEKLGAEGA